MSTAPLAGITSILVAVDGSDAAYHALSIAADLAKRARARLHLIHVIEVPRSVPLDAPIEGELQRAEEILERAERIAESCGTRVSGDLLQARQAGHAVVDEAIERGVDTIILGIPYERPYGQYETGEFASYILEHSPVQVWLIREAEPSAR